MSKECSATQVVESIRPLALPAFGYTQGKHAEELQLAMDEKPVAPWIRNLSRSILTVTLASLMTTFVSSGDVHKISILVSCFGVSAMFAMAAIVCVIKKSVPAFTSQYGRVSVTYQKTKPVQYFLCVFLFVSISILLLFAAAQRYAELYPGQS